MTQEQLQLLDFKIIKRPLQIVGKAENRPYPNRKALIHSRTGEPLDICSDRYHPHQPLAIVSEIEQQIRGIAEIKNLQVLQGGRNVVLDCQFTPSYQDQIPSQPDAIQTFLATGQDLPYNEKKQARHDAGYRQGQALGMGNGFYHTGFKISIGNTVGNPCQLIGQMTEIVCLNGLLRQVAKSLSVVTHRNDTSHVNENLLKAIPEIQTQIQVLTQARTSLIAQPATTEHMRAYLLELTDKELFETVLDKTIAHRGQYTPDVQRNMFLESVTSHDQVAWFLLKSIDENGNRLCKRMNEILTDQPLAEGTRGTLWQPYMAATYAIDHKAPTRGNHADDNRVWQSSFGEGAKMKVAALDLALAYQQALTN